MESTNYLNMMLSGYFKNPDLLKLHLIRNQQLAERDNFVNLIEFYDNCNKTINDVKNKILNLYNNQKNELYSVLSVYKTKNKDTSEIQKEIDYLKPDNFGIPLFTLTNQQFTGHLYYKDIEFIENTLKQIFIYVDKKKDYHLQCNEGNFLYSGAENKLYTGREYFEKIYLSKDNLKFPINFPDLIPKYYDLSLEKYLSNEKNKAKEIFSKKWVAIEFVNSELEKLILSINGLNDFLDKNKHQSFKHKKEQLKYSKRYSEFLKDKLKELDKTEVEKPLQTENNAKKKTKKNERIDIFKDDLGFTLFYELHEIYKNKNYQQANYSFLYYALEKEYLVCKGIDFINFLAENDIIIDKIDSRQYGTNKKSDLFNSIKANLISYQ